MKNRTVLILIGFMLLFGLQTLSAQTPIVGKIYNSDFSEVISGASITVYCGTSSLSATSLNDGTYGVIFDDSACTISDSISVEASKDNLEGSGTGVVVECTESDCEGEYVAIVNLNLKNKPTSKSSSSSSSSGGSYRGYYNCGNNKCDTGETAKTCALDCAPAVVDNESNDEVLELASDTEIVNEGDDTPTSSGITGGVIGFAKSGTGISLGVLIVIIGIVLLTLVNRKNALR